MIYIPEAHIEAQGAELWRTQKLEPGFDIEMLLDQLGLGLLWEELPESQGTKVLGAINLNEVQVILNERHFVDLEGNPGLRRFTIGHEIGHWSLHAMAIRSGTLS